MADDAPQIHLRPRPPNMTDEQWRQWVEDELSDGAGTFNKLTAEMKSNTDITTQIKKDTGEMVELFRNLQAAFRVLNGIGRVLKPIGIILGVCSAAAGLYATLRYGATPPPPK